MNATNPYAQGWGSNSGSTSSSPTFGALPAASNETSSTLVAFFFVSNNHDILNSSVIGSNSQKYFNIQSTPYGGTDYTNFRRPSGETFSVIEWNGRPRVELQNRFLRDYAFRWIPVSPDGTTRTVTVDAKKYTWMHAANGMVYVYPYGEDTRSLVARVVRGREAITLEMTVSALQENLLEPFVVAIALVFSGRAIE